MHVPDCFQDLNSCFCLREFCIARMYTRRFYMSSVGADCDQYRIGTHKRSLDVQMIAVQMHSFAICCWTNGILY